MKVAITGEHGYVGQAIGKWLKKRGFVEDDIIFISVRDDFWKNLSFAGIDVVIHCAALVHKNQKEIPLEEYLRVNTALTTEIASKAKSEGVKKIVFMSTKGVYGVHKSCFGEVVVNESTPLQPFKKYGVSKKKAEDALLSLRDNLFSVAIIRAPFIYGKGCGGNYKNLRKLVLKYHFVPKMASKISMLYIDNLCELVYLIMKNDLNGIFLPQNLPIHSTSELALLIAKYNNVRVLNTFIFNSLLRTISIFCKPVKSAFGSSIYDESCSGIEGINYQIVSFEDSVKTTES